MDQSNSISHLGNGYRQSCAVCLLQPVSHSVLEIGRSSFPGSLRVNSHKRKEENLNPKYCSFSEHDWEVNTPSLQWERYSIPFTEFKHRCAL